MLGSFLFARLLCFLQVSFFKGSLDLLEAIFDELGAETARFDGDISSEERENELDRFKMHASCRILLMTVQTGGTGMWCNFQFMRIAVLNATYGHF